MKEYVQSQELNSRNSGSWNKSDSKKSLQNCDVEISLTTFDDADEFLKLEARAFSMKYDQQILYYWGPILNYFLSHKAVSGGRIIGGIIAMPTRNGASYDGECYINSIFVDPLWRKKGIATKLLQTLFNMVGNKSLILEVKEDAILLQFYEKRGFVQEKVIKNYCGDGTDRVLMIRRGV